MMTVMVAIIEAADPTVSGKKTEIMLLRTPNQALWISPLVIQTGGQKY